MDRRSFLLSVGSLAVSPLLKPAASLRTGWVKGIRRNSINDIAATVADHRLTIEPCSIEISPGLNIKTVGYNGRVPGPVLRLGRRVPVAIDVLNRTENPDLVHWHGLETDSRNDGAMEEGSPMIPAGGHLRYTFSPHPSGTRWYHTHAGAGNNLSLGTYTGQFGFLIVDGDDPGYYDQEILLAVHHWEPSFVPMLQMMQASANHPMNPGSDVAYKYATINQHRLGAGEPIRVKQGQRVLMRLLNASATENVILSFPAHTFRVISMDGNPVPVPREVEVISLAAAERVDAIVEMKSPGVWILGSTLQKSREMGLGIVVEYSGCSGAPVWKDPLNTVWDYTHFANRSPAAHPDETVPLEFTDIGPQGNSKFDTWTINGQSWPDIDPIRVKRGNRYRLVFRNNSGDQHPMHLHRHTFEVTNIAGKNISGLRKDVVNVMPQQTVAVDFMADNPGDTLMHCHMQLHMDFGFMQLIKYMD